MIQGVDARPAVSRWFLRPIPNAAARLRLFCLPHAGADTWVYQDWQRGLPAYVEVCPIRLPGRGSRMGEPLLTHMNELVAGIAGGVREALDLPFAIYGHSMGALVGFELARHLVRAERLLPKMLCVGSCRAPQVASFRPIISDLDPDRLLAVMGQRYGTEMPSGNDELMKLTLPIMRADLALCENYAHAEGAPLACPITAFAGMKDPTYNRADVEAWRRQTSGEFAKHEINGDHFFSIGSRPALLRLLSDDLEWAMAQDVD